MQLDVCQFKEDTGEQIDLTQFSGKDWFAMRVGDDSLVDAYIRNGDVLVVRPQPTARLGQLALVRTDPLPPCLRYWLNESGRIRLQPVSRSLPPSIVDQVEVLGVVVAVLRDLAIDGVARPYAI